MQCDGFTSGGAQNDFVGVRRSVEVLDGDEPQAVPVGSTINLTVERDRISARANCNTMSGESRVEDGVLLVEELSTTLVGCEQVAHEEDRWIAELLSSGPAIYEDSGQLVLRGEAATITFEPV